ncbi:hypothetical protein [Ornithinibacillus xuwenensis]|uniref:Uncharacterized protein n=1 Tax=Ornithinibacillus xuwenensis TaxID=3144668 RepID=A0ABU9XHY5_9BACI
MNDYETYRFFRKTYPAWNIHRVKDFFIEELQAIPIPMDHPDIQYHLQDPYIPKREKICGVYGIYKKSILSVLEGEVENINGIDFAMKKQKDVTLSIDDVETILEVGILVILEKDDQKHVSGAFIGGNAGKLYNLIDVFRGLPPLTHSKDDIISLRKFMSSLDTVNRMGFL